MTRGAFTFTFASIARRSVLAEDPPSPPVHHSTVMIVTTGLLAAFLVLIAWPILVHAITMSHEGMHALADSLFGNGIRHIELNRDGSGSTHPRAMGGMARFGALLAGYLGPSLFGLGGALLLVNGRSTAMLWLCLVFLAVMLVLVRNVFGWIAVLLTGGVVFLFARYGSPAVQTVFGFTLIWLLLIGGFRGVFDLRRARRTLKEAKQKDDKSDAFQLREMTYLPAALWVGFFWLATLAALVLGAGILLGVVAGPAG